MVQLQHIFLRHGITFFFLVISSHMIRKQKFLITLLRMTTFSVFPTKALKTIMLQTKTQSKLTPFFWVVKLLPTLVCASSRSISFMYDLRLPISSLGDTSWSGLWFSASKSSSSSSEKSNSSSSSRSSESNSSESAPMYYFVLVQIPSKSVQCPWTMRRSREGD